MRNSCEPKKLYRSNQVLRHIILANENTCKDVFRQAELKSISSADYDVLVDHQLLREVYRDVEKMTYYRNGSAYKIKKDGAGHIGYLLRGEGEPEIQLSKFDLVFIEFDFLKLAQFLKNKNGLSGKSGVLTKRMLFVGKYDDPKSSVNVVVGLFNNDSTAKKELFTLKSRLRGVKKHLSICPKFLLSEELAEDLNGKGIISCGWDAIFDEDFMIKSSFVNSEEGEGDPIPAISAKEQAGYKEHKYKCKDIIEFLDEKTDSRNVRIKINGKSSIDIPYSEAVLLILMAIKLKENNGGWVTYADLLSEGIIANDDALAHKKDADKLARFHRLVSDLRKSLGSKEIIQGLRGKSQCRISTHPQRVKEPKSNWLKQQYKHTVLPAVKKGRNKNER